MHLAGGPDAIGTRPSQRVVDVVEIGEQCQAGGQLCLTFRRDSDQCVGDEALSNRVDVAHELSTMSADPSRRIVVHARIVGLHPPRCIECGYFPPTARNAGVEPVRKRNHGTVTVDRQPLK